MLILTRKLGESITIGEHIKVTILGVFGRQVRLGVDAPPEVMVHREEVYLKIQDENREAAKVSDSDLREVKSMLEKTGELKKNKPAEIHFRKAKENHTRERKNGDI